MHIEVMRRPKISYLSAINLGAFEWRIDMIQMNYERISRIHREK